MRRSTLIFVAVCPVLALLLCLTVLRTPIAPEGVEAGGVLTAAAAPPVVLRAPSQASALAERDLAPHTTQRRQQVASDERPTARPNVAAVAAAPEASEPQPAPRVEHPNGAERAPLSKPATDVRDRVVTARGERASAQREPASAALERVPPPAPEPAVFASIEGVELTAPSVTPMYVGFHEAANPVALPLVPHGHLARNDNPGKTGAVTSAAAPHFTVLSSRGRAQSATTAVDIVLAPGDQVHSVVTGTVAEVRPYLLYEKYPDNRIEIIPDGRPDLRVTLIHMTGVQVSAGQHVVAGVTHLADGANQFPFLSHIDGYVDGERHAHVHVEVKRAS